LTYWHCANGDADISQIGRRFSVKKLVDQYIAKLYVMSDIIQACIKAAKAVIPILGQPNMMVHIQIIYLGGMSM